MKTGNILATLMLLPVTLLAAENRILKPEIVTIDSIEEYEGLLESGCSLGCAIGWRYQASSTLPGQGANRYNADKMGDASLSSAWVEGAAEYGVGEKLTITFSTLPGHKEGIAFRGIELVNGYAKNEAVWRANSRVKRMSVRYQGKPLFELALADTMSPQAFNFEDILIYPGDHLEMTILDVYPGDKYADTAISEINLDGAH
jgi:hypothetical protein